MEDKVDVCDSVPAYLNQDMILCHTTQVASDD